MRWFVDSEDLCIVRDDFIDLQLSAAIFWPLVSEQAQLLMAEGIDALSEQLQLQLAALERPGNYVCYEERSDMIRVLRGPDGVIINPDTLLFTRYRKKPVVVKAIEMLEPFEVDTLEGVMRGNAGDYLIKETKGELYPCKSYVFHDVYEVAE